MTATPRPAGARSIASALAAAAIAACAPTATADDPARVPPLDGQDAIEAWFAEAHYLAWACDAAPRDATHAGEIDCEDCHTLASWRTVRGGTARPRGGRR